ncbi:MAG: hypothetical protein EAZ27_02145 [Cytophagales bacterium]|nr:MAG: hypothetical protein EAZ27_02145 [Cytophagales bacterium]
MFLPRKNNKKSNLITVYTIKIGSRIQLINANFVINILKPFKLAFFEYTKPAITVFERIIIF